METYANLFSSSIAKNGIIAFYGRSLSKFKHGLVNGMNPRSNGIAVKFWILLYFILQVRLYGFMPWGLFILLSTGANAGY